MFPVLIVRLPFSAKSLKASVLQPAPRLFDPSLRMVVSPDHTSLPFPGSETFLIISSKSLIRGPKKQYNWREEKTLHAPSRRKKDLRSLTFHPENAFPGNT